MRPRARARSHRFLAVLRALAGALLGLLLAGQALPALHFALVAHEVCPEHGELRHALEAPHAVRSLPDAGVAVRDLDTARLEHEHEHCTTTSLSRSAALEVGASTSLPLLPSAAQHHAAPGARDAHSNLPILSFAPKLAPPA